MKDRQFMIVLALVVAAGLVMGLVAFRVSAGSASVGAQTVAGNAAVANDGQPHPSAANSEDTADDQPADTVPQSGEPSPQNGEPGKPSKEPPAMQGPGNGDPPGTAATAPSAPAAPGDPSSTPQ